jgi:hypothetical protein
MTIFEIIRALSDSIFQVFILFPYSALTIPRQRQLGPAQTSPKDCPAPTSADMKEIASDDTISDDLIALFTSQESVSSLLASDPTLAPGDAWKKLYGHHAGTHTAHKSEHSAGKRAVSTQALERAAKCGNWGATQPSELFLAVRPTPSH